MIKSIINFQVLILYFKDCSQSLWPEYAVKVMNASKIAELHYRDSCIREMACLQLFSHPNIARLVKIIYRVHPDIISDVYASGVMLSVQRICVSCS